MEALLPKMSIKPYRTENNAVYFDVSNADFNSFQEQIKDAIAFLQANKPDIQLLMSADNVSATLDFAIEWRDVAVQYDNFPAVLVREAGNLGLALEVSHYPTSERS